MQDERELALLATVRLPSARPGSDRPRLTI